MPVKFQNTEFRYTNTNGKPVYAPSDEGRGIGKKIKCLVEEKYKFDYFYSHFRAGGHINSLHGHRNSKFFSRLDIKNFFYSIGRNRVSRAMKDCGLKSYLHFAKWSTVRDPYTGSGYVLPYGFVQSPILSSLIFSMSPVGQYLREVSSLVTVTVYLDDIAISSDDLPLLNEIHIASERAVVASGFKLSPDKVIRPSPRIELFNCEVETGRVAVLNSRRQRFYASERSSASSAAFENYCQNVMSGNVR